MTPVFRLLGPIAVLEEGREIRIGAPRLRTLLAALLVNANQTVSATELGHWLWAGEPPARPLHALHTAVSRLRAILGPQAGLRTVAGGYRLDLTDERLDLHRFRALAAVGTVEALAEALDLWQGEPLTGALDTPAVRDQRTVLQEEWLHATELLIDARLARQEHAELIPELTALTKQYPLRERFWAQLMLALNSSARQTDALTAYHELAQLLRDELGIDPGEEVRRLHLAVLAGDGKPVPPSPRPTVSAPSRSIWRVHRQLPIDIGDFVGRQDEAEAIAARLTDSDGVPVVTISGPPGAGKTALAVRVAHRLCSRYPDGQWYVRLDGASGPARQPAEVLRNLLELAGDEACTGNDVDVLAARLRGLLADRRVLILLDDAKDSEQVRPLLPGSQDCAVLVTSRNALGGLREHDSALGTSVAVLEHSEAVELLRGVLGSHRAEAEPAATAELARLCGCLPLALRIAAGHLAVRVDESIASYNEQLRSNNRLLVLTVAGEPDAAVEVAFARSYEALEPAAQRLFALLGLVPGPDVTVPIAAALLGTGEADAATLLGALLNANLIVRDHDRFRMHDLIRLYAEQRAEVEPEADQAWYRLCRWYLETADAATQRDYLPPVRITPRIGSATFPTDEAAARWLEDEEAGLVAVIKRAEEHGPATIAWQLADVVRSYLTLNNRVDAWRAAVTAGLAAARAAGDLGGQGAMLHSLGTLQFITGDNTTAVELARQAADLYEQAGFRLGHAALLCNIGMAYDDQGDAIHAAELLSRGVAELREFDQPAALVNALNSLSNAECNRGNLRAAFAAAEEGVNRAPDARSRTVGLFNRGAVHRLLGQLDAAEADLVRAVEGNHESLPLQYEAALLYADLGSLEKAETLARRALTQGRSNGQPWHEAAAQNTLGVIYCRRGRWNDAARHHRAARGIARTYGHHATVAESLLGLAQADRGGGQHGRAVALAQEALQTARQLGLRIVACRALLLLAELEPDAGHAEEAAAIQAETGYVSWTAPADAG